MTLSEQQKQQILAVKDSPGVQVIIEVIASNIRELEDVRNIDAKGNMGLQALANQQAVKKLDDIFTKIGLVEQGAPQKVLSQYR